MNERILVASIVGPGKRYCERLLPSQLSGLESREYLVAFGGRSFPLPEGAEAIYCDAGGRERPDYEARAYAREAIRQAFLARPFWKWLYWHDADMVAPQQAISKLLSTARQHNADLAAASYFLRGKRGPVLPVLLGRGHDRSAPFKLARSPRGLPKEGVCPVAGVGLGATLVSRRVLEAVPFLSGGRNACPDHWREDLAWSLRASEQGFKVVLDRSMLAQHRDAHGNDAARPHAEADGLRAARPHAEAVPAEPVLTAGTFSVSPVPVVIDEQPVEAP